MNRLALAALALALAACQRDAPPPAETATTTKAAEAQKPAEAPKPPEPPKATPKTPRAERKAAAAIKWPDGVEWADDWAAARARSAESGKPICLVVYADWCPRCKELTPVFADPEVIEASKGLVMVRQDNDAKPDWLMAYADQGTYVPRIFFFGADGNLRTDLTSGHPRFPFFYTPTGKSALLRSMRAAAGG